MLKLDEPSSALPSLVCRALRRLLATASFLSCSCRVRVKKFCVRSTFWQSSRPASQPYIYPGQSLNVTALGASSVKSRWCSGRNPWEEDKRFAQFVCQSLFSGAHQRLRTLLRMETTLRTYAIRWHDHL